MGGAKVDGLADGSPPLLGGGEQVRQSGCAGACKVAPPMGSVSCAGRSGHRTGPDSPGRFPGPGERLAATGPCPPDFGAPPAVLEAMREAMDG
ncbi:hypothetical protein GCM10010300_82760 [Streptomyces olivaceoviridis]|nr:hypothetical protein GCM10010300_82760 [Streptomyces olivaceoviridis]